MTEQKMVKVPAFVSRMLEEEADLSAKYERLSVAVDPTTRMDLVPGVSPEEHTETMYLMVRQHEYMKGYLYVLRQRIRKLSIQYGFEFKS
tara:strand:- start:1489 stop:1758 length:270 start_codon:yes stop_codon:yes gene_type:complete